MPKYNDTFELSVEDIDLIEAALRRSKRDLSLKGLIPSRDRMKSGEEADAADQSLRRIHDLLGRLHNQKVFYRPGNRAFIGG